MNKPTDNSHSVPIEFYLTAAHDCPYLPNYQAKTLFLSPQHEPSPQIYGGLIQQGFRRSGDHIYRPHCDQCQSCISVRLLALEHQATKQHKRCLNKAKSFTTTISKAQFDYGHYRLFEKYINIRHSDGDMFPTSQKQYRDFILSNWMDTYFLDIFNGSGELIACAVFDQLNDGLSAIYTFFDPEYSNFSLGRLAILKLVEICQQRKQSHLYLGFWIKDCQKMSYKGDYRPLECFIDKKWLRLN